MVFQNNGNNNQTSKKRAMFSIFLQKSRIWETQDLSTDADSSTAAKKLLSIFYPSPLPSAIVTFLLIFGGFICPLPLEN